jgi:hypothetical protein
MPTTAAITQPIASSTDHVASILEGRGRRSQMIPVPAPSSAPATSRRPY